MRRLLAVLRGPERHPDRDADRMLRLVEQVAKVGHWRLDLATDALTWSDEVYRMHGLERGSYAPTIETAIEAYHPDDRGVVVRILEETVARKDAYEFDLRIVRPDGEVRNVMCRGLPEIDARGQIKALFGTITDVTELKRAEAAVRESEIRYRLLAENTSELIVLAHDDGRRSYISPSAVRLLGFTPEELGAMGSRDCVHPDDLAMLRDETGSLAEGKPEASIVFRALHKRGGWIWVEGCFRRILEARGDDPTIVATFRDVSERHAQSAASEAAKAFAEQAQAAAEQASLAKTDFLASMSHEIRTPLNGILGYTDLLLEDRELKDEHRRRVERVKGAGDALLTVVSDVLDFSKIEAGRIDLEPRPFHVASLVEESLSIVQGLADAKRLTLATAIDATVPNRAIGDPNRLRQVLLNLLNNAVKFTAAGTVTLSVSCCAIDDGAATLRFSVEDTGLGIAADKLSRLFKRFSQVDGSIRREFGGTGLGLAISKTLVETMGGAVGVESHPGRGSIFWFTVTLPIGHASQPEPRPASAATRRPALILLVEDTELNQDLARSVIEAAGHLVDVVADGAAAIAAVQAKAYDLVLMDVQMPGIDGLTATRCIRQLPGAAADVPIVAMTANVLPAQVARALASGMNDHVGKPCKREELHAAIARWTEHRRGRERDGERPDHPSAFDRDVHRTLRDLVGDAGMEALLAKLATELTTRLSDVHLLANDQAKLARVAHDITPAAAMLGFPALSDLCARLDQACQKGPVCASLLDAFDRARRDALSEIESFGLVA